MLDDLVEEAAQGAFEVGAEAVFSGATWKTRLLKIGGALVGIGGLVGVIAGIVTGSILWGALGAAGVLAGIVLYVIALIGDRS